jgi:hypothetical protein
MRIGMGQGDKGPPLPRSVERHHIPGWFPLNFAHVTPPEPDLQSFSLICTFLQFFAGICIPLQKIASPLKLPKN